MQSRKKKIKAYQSLEGKNEKQMKQTAPTTEVVTANNASYAWIV